MDIADTVTNVLQIKTNTEDLLSKNIRSEVFRFFHPKKVLNLLNLHLPNRFSTSISDVPNFFQLTSTFSFSTNNKRENEREREREGERDKVRERMSVCVREREMDRLS